MGTSRLPVKVRLSQESYRELHELHPSYGEAGRIIRELVEGYVMARKAGKQEVNALAEAILGKVR